MKPYRAIDGIGVVEGLVDAFEHYGPAMWETVYLCEGRALVADSLNVCREAGLLE